MRKDSSEIAIVYSQLLKEVVANKQVEGIDDNFIDYIKPLTEIYRREIKSDPEKLLEILRTTEVRFQDEIGKSYYIEFFRTIEKTKITSDLLLRKLESENLLTNEVIQNYSNEKLNTLLKTSSFELIRPRHFIFYCLNTFESVFEKIFNQTLLSKKIHSYYYDNLERLYEVDKWIINPSEKHIDINFLKIYEDNKEEDKLELETNEIIQNISLLTNDVKVINNEVSEMSQFWKETTNWAKKITQEKFSPNPHGEA